MFGRFIYNEKVNMTKDTFFKKNEEVEDIN